MPASKAAAKARTTKPRAAKATSPAEPKKILHPWDDIPEEASQTYVVDLPARLHCKLKWLGGMTWGSSMRKIVVAALEKEADRLLKENGVGVE